MAVKVQKNGFIEIKTEEDALEALTRFRNLKAEIDEVRADSGLDELEKDAVAYKAATEAFMVQARLKHIQGDGFHGTLVEGTGSSQWIATDDDLKVGTPKRCKSLQSIIEKKFKSSIGEKGSKARKMWMRITKRVLDPEAIEELVNEGVLDVDEISPAWYEVPRKPYLRLYEDE